ncbi:MAG: hypothetical protein JWQ38_2587 [Flavipsychrobacter sp.]|nr:hypothetical protein [Flavipsychrobacter sp.]
MLTGILLSGCTLTSMAQSDTLSEKKEKKINHSIGVQVNDLVKQILNFNSSTTSTNTNPYQLTYSINSANKGWGIRVGVGYNYRSSSSNDGITSTKTNLDDVHARIGIERAYKISKKWTTGIGIDGVYNNDNDHTTSMVSVITSTGFSGGTTTVIRTTDTKTTVSSKGGGPQGWLRYAISQRVLIGTEASFYYVTGTQSNLIRIDGVSNAPKVSNYLKVVSFSLPVVLFVNVRF